MESRQQTRKEEIAEIQRRFGVMQAVYSYPNPELRELVIPGVVNGTEMSFRSVAPAWTEVEPLDYGMDRAGVPVMEKFLLEFESMMKFEKTDFPNRYWTPGGYHGLFHLFNHIANNCLEKPYIYVFHGEYEGVFEHITGQNNLPAVAVPESVPPKHLVRKGIDYLYVSQPNARDGRVIDPAVLQEWSDAGAKIILDAAYLGMVDEHIDATMPGIWAIVFSFSKLGFFYQRMGFTICREEIPSLYAVNEWFLSLPAIGVAKTILAVHPKYANFVREYSARMRLRQQMALVEIENRTGLPLKASPVWLIGLLDQERILLREAYEKFPGLIYFTRGSAQVGEKSEVRFCLTPTFLWQDLQL